MALHQQKPKAHGGPWSMVTPNGANISLLVGKNPRETELMMQQYPFTIMFSLPNWIEPTTQSVSVVGQYQDNRTKKRRPCYLYFRLDTQKGEVLFSGSLHDMTLLVAFDRTRAIKPTTPVVVKQEQDADADADMKIADQKVQKTSTSAPARTSKKGEKYPAHPLLGNWKSEHTPDPMATIAEKNNANIGRLNVKRVKDAEGNYLPFPPKEYKSVWENTFAIDKKADNANMERKRVLVAYLNKIQEKIETQPGTYDLSELQGKKLYCWCAPLYCHGDILQYLLEKKYSPAPAYSPRVLGLLSFLGLKTQK
jgi:hypothetical protein